jgi:hypothetical protein
MGSAVDSAFDFAGDVAGGIGDVIGDVAETAVDYAPEIAAIVAAYYTGNPEFLAADTFGSSTAAEILASEAASAAAASGATASGIGNLSNFLPGSVPGGGYTGGMISTGIEGLDSALNLAKSGYNLYGLYNQANQPQTISQQYNQIQPLTVQQTSQGTSVNPQQFSQGLQYITYSNSPELNQINSIINQPQYKANDALSNIGATDISDAIKKFGPSIISVIGGKLAYDDQKRINDIIMGAYNKYNVGTELKGLQYRTGQGLPSLPVYRSNKALGSQTTQTAPARTAADVVYKPVAKANGGRIGYADGNLAAHPQILTKAIGLLQDPKMANTLPNIQDVMQKAKRDPQLMATIKKVLPMIQSRTNAAKGGLMNVMNHEMDLRAKGGFVPIGKKERADDVPARLSLNEFVMTAKAVRNAGKGSVNKGAKKMYSLMKHLEKGASL